MKRIVCLFLALVMAVGMAVVASAEETTQAPEDKSYILSYDGEYLPWLWSTQYIVKYQTTEIPAGKRTTPMIFNMVDTQTESSIAVYCTDVNTGTVANSNYRRINLEDSTYHLNGAAEKLRSITMKSFPYLTLEEISVLANAAGYSVTDLTVGEALDAAQLAIWETTHGSDFTVTSFYDGYDPWDDGYYITQIVHPETLSDPESDYTESNIANLYHYYVSLEGTAPMTDAVSEYSLENVHISKVENGDGTVTVRAYASVNTTVKEGDTLTLTAVMGDQILEQSVTAAGNYWFEFSPVAQVSAVDIVISGTQKGGDVYLFEAEGGRDASQPMVGYDESVLPVYGKRTIDPNDRVVNIYKTTETEDGKKPLANIQFAIYKVGTLADYINGTLDIGTVPTEADIAKYQTEENYITTLTTNVQGFATYNFGQEDAVYLVVELANDAIVQPVSPFFLQIPYPNDDGGMDYTVNVYPKNTVKPEDVQIEKDVTELDNDEDTFAVGQTHTWIIRSSIPDGLANAQRYEISDTLDHRLSYIGNVRVTAGNDEVELLADTDYALAVSKVTDDQGHSVDRFVISLTVAGMQNAAAAGGEIRVYFDAQINQSATLATDIPNQAHVDYTNSVGRDYEDDSDVPRVYTGGLKINKVDGKEPDRKLAGAIFRIARYGTAQEVAAGSYELLTDGETEQKVVYLSFYTTADLSGEKVSEVATGEDGVALLYGLAYGEYFLVETKAPDGYNRLPGPVKVTVNAISHLDDDGSTETDEGDSVTVRNSAGTELPSTGGMGTTMFYTFGTMLVLAAAVLLVTKRRMCI